MSSLLKILAKSSLLKDDRDYHLVRASMTQRFANWVYASAYPTLGRNRPSGGDFRGGNRERTL